MVLTIPWVDGRGIRGDAKRGDAHASGHGHDSGYDVAPDLVFDRPLLADSLVLESPCGAPSPL